MRLGNDPTKVSLPKTHRATRQPPEVIQSHFGTIRTASVLPQKTKIRIANGQRFCILTRAFASRLRSGSFARVKVMQAADFRNLDHLTERRKLDGSADGRIFFERQMRTASFVRVDNATPIILNREKSVTPGILGMLALWRSTEL